MTSSDIREIFLEFFSAKGGSAPGGKGHVIVSSSSLLPTDTSVLFTTAGMQQFKPYYTGEESPFGKNVASVQKCVRTSDIDEVGDESHLTFFEMLGNFSFGGYFKKEAIEYAHGFITKKLGLEIDYVTIFEDGSEKDEESEKIWKEIDNEIEIKKSGRKDNFWGPTGDEGPCGPTTEIYVRGIEIWNLVFNEYYKNKDGNYEKLKTPGVDTGMGLERLAMVVQKKNNIFETDLFAPIIKKIESFAISGKQSAVSVRIIADHIKASVFIIADGVELSNVGRGYVLRRLIRRAARHGKLLGIEKNFTKEIAESVIEIYEDFYPEVAEKKDKIFEELKNEEEKFVKTLERGLKELNKLNLIGEAQRMEPEQEIKKFNRVDAKKAFYIYETFGFPLEMIQEELAKRGLSVDKEKFKKEMGQHQEKSRTASAGMFKGGLADAGEQTTKYHTTTHLLHQALRDVLGNHVIQKGSNITAERLRFDFSHSQKVTPEQIKQVEDIVNEKIRENLPVICDEMSLEEARKSGALGVFEQKYGDKVKVYFIGNPSTGLPDRQAGSGRAFSAEICGGPHTGITGELGKFKILKEEASAAGIRRIKAVLE